MNELQLFDFKGQQVRTMLINDEPYFVGKDVAEILGYADSSSAVSKNVESEDKTTLLLGQDGSNYKSKTTIINESGLYSLILSSKLPRAKEFKRWVTKEVLPSIRKTGSYDKRLSQFANMNLTDQLLMIATEQQKEVQAQNKRIAAIEEEIETTRYLHPAERKELDTTVKSKVYKMIAEDGFREYASDVSGIYFRFISKVLQTSFGVSNRGMILQKDFKQAKEMVELLNSTEEVRKKAREKVEEVEKNIQVVLEW